MLTILTIAVSILASLCAADAVVRLLLFVRARAPRTESVRRTPERPLVVIPARNEGAQVAATVASAAGAAVVLLIDGADPEAEAAGRSLGATVLVKEPAGPTKAAALAWLAREHRPMIEAASGVLLLDVGSALEPAFFDHFSWPDGVDALQAYLHGGRGGAADSERLAQYDEDRGREAMGWNVRLRGTGTAFRPQVFLDVVPRLTTRVEDFEASLLLHRAKLRMADPAAVVRDAKPASVHEAASQRARWIAGRYELLLRRGGEIARWIARRPFEGTAFLLEMFGRPLSLTVPLRFVAGLWLAWRGLPVLGGLIAASTLIDVALFAGRTSPAAALHLAGSWILAVVMAPRALWRWTRVKR